MVKTHLFYLFLMWLRFKKISYDFMMKVGKFIRGQNKENFIIEDGILKKYIDIGKAAEVIIPDGVTSIGPDAFGYCINLKRIIIPNSVTSIDRFAFRDCVTLKSVIIPDSVVMIGDSAFSGCTSLTEVIIPASVTNISNGLFINCKSLQNITIPNSVTSVGVWAFGYCENLIRVIIPNSVTRIGASAFEDCFNLTEVKIENNLASIGRFAFRNCKNLKSLKHNYKAFRFDEDRNLYAKQNNMPYKLDRTEKLNDKIEICKTGFHYCTNIFDIFNYYAGEYNKDFIIALCDVNENNIQTTEENSKCCTDELTPKRLLTEQEIISLMNGKDIF